MMGRVLAVGRPILVKNSVVVSAVRSRSCDQQSPPLTSRGLAAFSCWYDVSGKSLSLSPAAVMPCTSLLPPCVGGGSLLYFGRHHGRAHMYCLFYFGHLGRTHHVLLLSVYGKSKLNKCWVFTTILNNDFNKSNGFSKK
jgi:hypothetical protein